MFNWGKFSSRSFDWPLAIAVFLLMSLGLAALYSIDLSRGGGTSVFFRKQALIGLVGMICAAMICMVQYNFYRMYAKWIYAGVLVLLLGVLVFGTVLRGTRGWFEIGGFTLQPVEFAKVAVVLILAYIISSFGRRFDRPLFFLGSGIVVLLAMGLVLLQPDLGSAAVLGLVWFGLIILVKTRRLYVFLLVAAGIAVSVVAWYFLLQPYQKDRILIFVEPNRDPLGAGYNITQAKIAIGSGQLFGRGLGFGSQSQLRFLPEAQTDFIFSVISEELGLAGSTFLIGLIGVILWRLYVIARRADDDFISAAVSGSAILLFVQFFINVGANLGILPITGITLPFVSYGGSSLLANWVLIGLVESMVVRRY